MIVNRDAYGLAFMMIEYFANQSGNSIADSVTLKEKSNQLIYFNDFIIILNLN